MPEDDDFALKDDGLDEELVLQGKVVSLDERRGGVEKRACVSCDELYDRVIEPLLLRLALYIDGRYASPTAAVRLREGELSLLNSAELGRFLYERSSGYVDDVWRVLEEESLYGDILLRFFNDYDGSVFALVTTLRDPFLGKYPPGDSAYVFNSREILSGKDYLNRRYWHIQHFVQEKYGLESAQAFGVERAIGLVRAFLFAEISEEDRVELYQELSALREAIGDAVSSVIYDFVREFKVRVRSRDENLSFNKIDLERLKAGALDLSDLIDDEQAYL